MPFRALRADRACVDGAPRYVDVPGPAENFVNRSPRPLDLSAHATALAESAPDDPRRARGTRTVRDRPRERLKDFGPAALSDTELVALLLRTGSATRTALELGAATLDASQGLRGLATAVLAELEAVPGVGPAKAASLVAAAELGRRGAEERLERGDLLRGPGDVHRHFAPRLRDEVCERFLVVPLDGRHRVIGDVTVSQGTLTASLVHPREVFRPAIRRSAAAIVLVHNHPSGDPTPSSEDHDVTRRLQQAGELIGIRVVDHVVVADKGYHSFDEAGEMGGSRGTL